MKSVGSPMEIHDRSNPFNNLWIFNIPGAEIRKKISKYTKTQTNYFRKPGKILVSLKKENFLTSFWLKNREKYSIQIRKTTPEILSKKTVPGGKITFFNCVDIETKNHWHSFDIFVDIENYWRNYWHWHLTMMTLKAGCTCTHPRCRQSPSSFWEKIAIACKTLTDVITTWWWCWQWWHWWLLWWWWWWWRWKLQLIAKRLDDITLVMMRRAKHTD